MFVDQLWRACVAAFRQQAFYDAYFRTFDVVEADTDALRERVFQLRHQVFGVENDMKGLAALKEDAFDPYSVHHLLIHRETGESAGAVRIVLPREEAPKSSLPLQALSDHPLLHTPDRVQTLCEISQMCIAPRFRRRQGDGRILPGYNEQDRVNVPMLGKIVTIRRQIPYAPLGLIRAAFETALRHRIVDCVTMVEPDHVRSLHRAGLSWRVLGPRLHHQGIWQPMICNVKNALDAMRTNNPPCWEVVSDRGRLHEAARRFQENDWQDRIFDESCREMIYRKLPR